MNLEKVITDVLATHLDGADEEALASLAKQITDAVRTHSSSEGTAAVPKPKPAVGKAKSDGKKPPNIYASFVSVFHRLQVVPDGKVGKEMPPPELSDMIVTPASNFSKPDSASAKLFDADESLMPLEPITLMEMARTLHAKIPNGMRAAAVMYGLLTNQVRIDIAQWAKTLKVD